METLFKLIELALLLIEILDESPPSLLHLVQPAFQPLDDAGHRPFDLSPVLGVPDVVGDELFDGFSPLVLEQLLVAHNLELVHESIHVFYQNVVTSD